MDLRELRYFLAIAQEGSISKAAEALFVSQPSLSKQMKNLEEEIGGALFIRGSRKIELTQLGMILRRRAQELLDLYSMTESELRAPVGSISGDIFIGGGESHAISVIAEAAKAMKADHPDVRFRFFSGDATEVIEKLEKGLLDFGVLLDYPDTSAFESVTLPLKDRWGALVRKDSDLAALSSVTPRDLEGRPLICSEQSLSKGLISSWMGASPEKLNIAATYNLLYNATHFVRAGLGCAISLDRLINLSEDGDLRFIPLSPAIETRLDVVYKKYRPMTDQASVFAEYLKKYCDRDR